MCSVQNLRLEAKLFPHDMNGPHLFLLLLSGLVTNSGQRDAVCLGGSCRFLVVQNGLAQFIDKSSVPVRTIALGQYLSSAQRFVPSTEASIREVTSPSGWRIVVSSFLHHDPDDLGVPGLHLRFFKSAGSLKLTEVVPMMLDQVSLGRLGGDDLFAASAEEEHAYNVTTKIWYVPPHGRPKLVMNSQGMYERFVDEVGKSPLGVQVARETYDGLHAETKGRKVEFWTWNASSKTLSLKAPGSSVGISR